MIRSESLGTTVRTAFTVCSLTTGATSENPVTYEGQNKLEDSLDAAYHLRKDFIADKFLWEMIDHQRQIVQEAHTNASVRVGE